MTSDDIPDLSELERAVMLLIWAGGSLTAEAVRERLKRGLKESTVRTVLRRLEDKGYVTHDIDGRAFLYHAAATRGDVAARGVKRLVDWFCNGSMDEMLVGMVENRMLDSKQIEELARLIGAPKKGRK